MTHLTGQLLFIFIYFMALAVLMLFGLHKYYLLFLFRKYDKQTADTPQDPETWPAVVVQLPIFNERYVVKRLLKAVARFDYPQEKLHIQVLDDSTDKTSELVKRLVRVLKKRGFSIDHIHRKDRTGFKAGALDRGMKQTDVDIIAVFDADFIPHPGFLKETIPHLLLPNTGMVQTRWGHINRNYSMLTRLQAILLDGHFLIEHFARDRSGKFFNFNGTAGIWRRQAIEDAGGWTHDTLTEDLDLSYRAQLAGWKFRFLPNIISPAELPIGMNAFKTQQHRWAKGSIQTGMKLIGRILKSGLPFHIRLEAIIHLSSNIAYLVISIPAILMIPVIRYQVEAGIHWPALVYLIIFLCATFSVILYYGQAVKLALGSIWPNALYVPAMMALAIGLSVNNGFATLEALLHRETPFIRTPKLKIEKNSDSWKNSLYRAKMSPLAIIELLLGTYFTYGIIYCINHQQYTALPFLILFQSGYLYTAGKSLIEMRA